MTQAAKHKRRWLSIRLRTFLILISAISIWLAWIIPRAQRQNETAQWIRSFESQPYYGYQFDSNNTLHSTRTAPVPRWLQTTLGIDYFSQIEMVHLDNNPVKDISPIADLHGLRHFELSSCQVSDLAPLRGLSDLEHLSVSHNPIADISSLSHLKRIKRLYAFCTDIDDLTALQNLNGLEHLLLRRTKITDISPLADLPNLAHLDISQTSVADITPLMKLKSLSTLNVSNTAVPDAQIDELQALLPNCKITR